MAEKSRAEYFRELRKAKKQLVFMVDKEKAEALDPPAKKLWTPKSPNLSA